MKKSAYLTPGEHELMEILWPMGEASVKAVWERVDPSRALAYTTVMTVLEKMYRKGMLKQRKKGKAYLYSPILTQEEARKGVLNHVCQIYFRGSQAELARFVQDQYSSQEPNPDTPAIHETPKPGS